jgi:hypothetical protein
MAQGPINPVLQPAATGVDCIVVGGCANGVLLKAIRPDASWIELARPEYIKPLASAFQAMPEVAHESDKYEVHPLSFTNAKGERPHLFCIAVVEGQSLTWAFSQLVIGYVENVTNKLMAANLIEKH